MKGLVLEAEWKPKPDYKLSDFERETGKAVTGSSVWKNPKLGVKEVKDPRPAPGQLLIEVKACGVCGSDMHFYETDDDGYIKYPGLSKFPSILGHEFSGRVIELGKGVKGFRVGDRVTAEEMIWCGECTPCRNGYPNQCENLEEIGFTINGAFAKYIAIGAKYCWKLNALERVCANDDEIYEAGATVEPTCVAYNGMFERAGGFRPGAYVVVWGAGPIGLAATGLSRAGGAGKVIVFEVSAGRRKIAKKMGADAVFDPAKLCAKTAIMEETSGEGVNLHVEAAGAPSRTIPVAEDTLAIGGKIVQIGRAAERVPLYLENFQVRASQVFGAQGHSGYANFPNVIRLMASGRIDTRKMITARLPLARAVDGIRQSTSRQDGKIMIKI